METPTLNEFLASLDKYVFANWYINGKFVPFSTIATELRALLADRDAWKAKAEAVAVPVARRLREVKGVMYNPNEKMPWVLYSTHRYTTAAGLIGSLPGQDLGLTDADHAAIYALKDDPYEAVETVEAVLKEVFGESLHHSGYFNRTAARIRQAVHAEQGAL